MTKMAGFQPDKRQQAMTLTAKTNNGFNVELNCLTNRKRIVEIRRNLAEMWGFDFWVEKANLTELEELVRFCQVSKEHLNTVLLVHRRGIGDFLDG